MTMEKVKLRCEELTVIMYILGRRLIFTCQQIYCLIVLVYQLHLKRRIEVGPCIVM